jgi:4-hydroxybenzoate polyprenyltransferase
MVKIFLIAIVWSYVTGVIPMYEQGTALRPLLIYFLEIVLFFIAITIPFDIRDLSVDRANDVKTLPYLLGRKLSTLIALFLLLITFFLDAGLVYWFHFDIRGTISMTFTCIITAGIIYAVRRKESDYYFSGLLETAIMFPYSIYVLILYFLS